jgi:hypothetical protein
LSKARDLVQEYHIGISIWAGYIGEGRVDGFATLDDF